MRKIFISYAREDYKIAKRLYDDLKGAGTDPWMDQEDLLVGQNWKEGVRRAIDESDFFLALISSTAVEKKGYYQSELNKALKILEEYPPDKIFLLPVRFDECIPKHEILQNLHWADLFPSYESGLKKILKTIEYLQKKKQPDAKIPELSETLKEPDDNVIFDKDRIEAHIVKAGIDNDEDKETIFEIFKRLSKSDRPAITNDFGMKFVFIPPGTFMMGSPKDEPDRFDNETLHKVTLTKGFYMQTRQVTVGQWKAFAKENGYRSEAETGDGAYGRTGSDWKKDKKYYWDNPGFSQTDTHPVTCISWNDAQALVKWLNQKENKRYRLPTEAEWEYACRAGTDTPFYFGKCLSADQANYNGNYPLKGCPKGEYRKKTTPVGSFEANAWGLYDMHGNVWEWCQDWYGDYPADAVTDPGGPDTSDGRVIRGGCWINFAQNCRSAIRIRISPDNRRINVGFRLVLTVQ